MMEFTEVEMLRMRVASLESLSEGKQEIWELFERMREEFDGSDTCKVRKTACGLLWRCWAHLR